MYSFPNLFVYIVVTFYKGLLPILIGILTYTGANTWSAMT